MYIYSFSLIDCGGVNAVCRVNYSVLHWEGGTVVCKVGAVLMDLFVVSGEIIGVGHRGGT